MLKPILFVHAGASMIPSDEKAEELLEGVKQVVNEGYGMLMTGKSCLDTVEFTVNLMENDDTFNAGKGAVVNVDGAVELDASIMVGANLRSGGVAVIKDVRNPVSVARRVMEKTEHVVLAGDGARRFAKEEGMPILPLGALVTHDAYKSRGDTVGCVAIDKDGKLVAATSGGGVYGKMVGGSSDSSKIGNGTYADDAVGAVSASGHGEAIATFCLAKSICNEMENGSTAQEAVSNCIETMRKKFKKTGGAICISKKGDVGFAFNTDKMPWAYRICDELHYGINQNEHNVIKICHCM